jgi:hypothetical protein
MEEVREKLVMKGLLIGVLGWLWWRLLETGELLYLDAVNLAIHEGGHLVFGGMGRVMAVGGGTLMQLLVPASIGWYFWRVRRELYEAGVVLWWVGQNLVNVGMYIADARVRRLQLIGDGTHDWGYLLGRVKLLPLAEVLGGGVRWTGLAIMAMALGFIGYVCWREFRETSFDRN